MFICSGTENSSLKQILYFNGMRLVKSLSILLLLVKLATMPVLGQGWTDSQLDQANSAKDVSYLTKEEKDAILYINLCRLFPKEFSERELEGYEMDRAFGAIVLAEFNKYKQSLQKDLQTRKAVGALAFDQTLYLDAKCYAAEISKAARSGHERVDCKESNYAECVSFGKQTGKDIALQLLIDSGVESLGHREICLDKAYKLVGISANQHFKYKHCAVLEFQ